MSEKKCLKCETGLGNSEASICDECSVEIFGSKETECELAWGCRENCRECICVDVK
jgi:hypothetical protein